MVAGQNATQEAPASAPYSQALPQSAMGFNTPESVAKTKQKSVSQCRPKTTKRTSRIKRPTNDLPALTALQLGSLQVQANVYTEVRRVAELLGTLVAAVGLRSSVAAEVHYEVAAVAELVRTLRAAKGLLACVHSTVAVKVALTG